MAGGTGGHIYPALACAEEFKKRQYDILWLGSKQSMEESIVPQYGIELKTIAIKGVRGKGVKGLLLAPFRVCQAVIQSFFILRNFQPDVVLGMGGFVSGPGGVAAKLLRIPLVVHEQNAIAGTTNTLLSNIANTVLQAFDGAFSQGVTVGNPIRTTILNNKLNEKTLKSGQSVNLLIIGGSLGAQHINQLIPNFLYNSKQDGRLNVWHQTGKNNIVEVSRLYKELDVDARVDAYIENMSDAYEWADLVLCRAGAMTVSELAIVGLPSILVPFPYAIDDHQTANAMYLVNAGAAKIIQQTSLTIELLTQLINELLDSNGTLLKMGQAAKKVAYPKATVLVADACERLIKND